MTSDGNPKSQPEEIDPATIEKLLEIELIQKRAEWKQTKARRGNLRMLSFLFLLVVIVGALVGFFYFFSSGAVNDLRARSTPTPASASP